MAGDIELEKQLWLLGINFILCLVSPLYLNLFVTHPNSKERVAELTQWLKSADFAKAERQPCGTKGLGEAVVSRLVEEVDKVATVRARVVKMQVRPHLLFKVCSSLSFYFIL